MMGTDIKDVLGENYSEAAYELYHRLQKVNIQSFIEGYYVYVWKPPPANCTYMKFWDPYKGPYKKLQKITDHAYKIDLGKGKYDTVH